jgi:hypothetical protein
MQADMLSREISGFVLDDHGNNLTFKSLILSHTTLEFIENFNVNKAKLR